MMNAEVRLQADRNLFTSHLSFLTSNLGKDRKDDHTNHFYICPNQQSDRMKLVHVLRLSSNNINATSAFIIHRSSFIIQQTCSKNTRPACPSFFSLKCGSVSAIT